MPPDIEAIDEQVFVALADPSRRAILAALASGGPATATDLAGRLPITRQAIAKHLALLTEAGLVTAEPGERRRVRYRLRSAPMQVAQQFLAALARDWDGPLDALKDHLGGTGTTNTATSRRTGDLSISPSPLTLAAVATCLRTRTPLAPRAAAPGGVW
jgi:DNA-binding transcriptional ArsR family regulator